MSATDQPPNRPFNWWKLGAFLLFGLIVINSLSDEDSNTNSDSTDLNAEPDYIGLPDETGLSTPVQSQIIKAARHAERAYGALGDDGASYYSELCYESLNRSFAPAELDRCYAFDLFANRLIENAGKSVGPKMSKWAVRSRWDSAGILSDLDSDDLETRRIAIEAATSRIRVSPELPPAIRRLQEQSAPSTDVDENDASRSAEGLPSDESLIDTGGEDAVSLDG
ncbi:hypothetical protein FSZ31_00990 [Sphingorhabdus soli]|uniref:Uncharacterized protein n=1 Tax=Flavisphingopyxis soli TaxID=2601267 RepID=A0A5C6UKN8_9SPHN|nr:hypothetical protein [Sphingorhabdus soli]TXC73369.1 hypothetical protein FSZ31_00990 [Sphingorhabdus soli]